MKDNVTISVSIRELLHTNVFNYALKTMAAANDISVGVSAEVSH